MPVSASLSLQLMPVSLSSSLKETHCSAIFPYTMISKLFCLVLLASNLSVWSHLSPDQPASQTLSGLSLSFLPVLFFPRQPFLSYSTDCLPNTPVHIRTTCLYCLLRWGKGHTYIVKNVVLDWENTFHWKVFLWKQKTHFHWWQQVQE